MKEFKNKSQHETQNVSKHMKHIQTKYKKRYHAKYPIFHNIAYNNTFRVICHRGNINIAHFRDHDYFLIYVLIES